MAKRKKIHLTDNQEVFVLEKVKERLKIAEDFQNPIFKRLAEYYEYYRLSYGTKDSDIWRANIKVPYIKQVVDTVLPRLVSSTCLIYGTFMFALQISESFVP